MQELIKITKQELNGEVVETSDARELHEWLGVKKAFATWIKGKLAKGMFEEGKSYFPTWEHRSDGKPGKGRIGYSLTTNTAEHIGMMESTIKGKELRQYYIDHRRESEKLIRILLIEKDCKINYLTEDFEEERKLRTRAARSQRHWMQLHRETLTKYKIKEAEAKIGDPNKDGNPLNKLKPAYATHVRKKECEPIAYDPTKPVQLKFPAIGE